MLVVDAPIVPACPLKSAEQESNLHPRGTNPVLYPLSYQRTD